MWVIVVQHEDDNHVTRVLGQYGAHELALSVADQFRKDHRGFAFNVHPVHPLLPSGTRSIEAPSSGDKEQ